MASGSSGALSVGSLLACLLLGVAPGCAGTTDGWPAGKTTDQGGLTDSLVVHDAGHLELTNPSDSRSDAGKPDSSKPHPPEGKWFSAPSLPKRTDSIPGFTAAGCLFVLTDGSKTMYRACQKSGGNLGSWTTLANSGYSTHWGYPSAVVVRSTISHLLLGPHWGYLKLSSVSHGNKTLGGWSNSSDIGTDTGGDRPIVWSAGTTVKSGGAIYLYSFGGFEYACPNFSCPQSVSDVFRAKVLSSGKIDKWVKDTSLTDSPMTSTAVTATVGGQTFIYVMGGSTTCCDGRWPVQRILRTTVGTDGKLGSWTKVRDLPYKAVGLLAFVRAGYLWIVGGSGDNWTLRKDVYSSKIGSGGGLGAFVAQISLPGPAAGTPHGFIGDYFYVVGASSGNSTPVYYAYFAP